MDTLSWKNSTAAAYPNCSLPPLPELKGFYPTFAIYTNGHVTLCVIAVGLLSNLLAYMAFFSHSVPRPNIYAYLMGLCLWDSLLLVSAGLLYSLPTVIFRRKRIEGFYVQILPIAFYLSNTTLMGSLWMIVALCVDRYIAICHPWRHRKMARKSLILRTLIGISLVVGLYSLPHLFDFNVYYCWGHHGHLEPHISLSSMRQNFYYRTMYKVMGGLMFYSLVPFVLLSILTARISVQLRIARVKRMEMTREDTMSQINSKKRRKDDLPTIEDTAPSLQKATKDKTSNNGLLLAVIAKFMACHLLPTILNVAEAVLGTAGFIGPVLVTYLVDLSNFLVVLNASTSTWLYFYYSSTFRADCARVLKGHICPKQISALRAAAPVFRATLRWNGALFVGRGLDSDINIFAEHPKLNKRRSAIPSIRSQSRGSRSPVNTLIKAELSEYDFVTLPVPSIPPEERWWEEATLSPPSSQRRPSSNSILPSSASSLFKRDNGDHGVPPTPEELQHLLKSFQAMEGTLV